MTTAMTADLTLVSHKLCPYVQRVAIVLAEKGIAFRRIDIDLAHKPDWFLRISPLGKTPVLLVGDQPIFESAVICDYLDETLAPRLHPHDALERARHRGWMQIASTVLDAISGFYSAPDEVALMAKASVIQRMFQPIEAELPDGPDGLYYGGERFTLVDAAFGPVFRYFDVFEEFGHFRFFEGLSRVKSWRETLAIRQSVMTAVDPAYPQLLRLFLLARNTALSVRMRETAAA